MVTGSSNIILDVNFAQSSMCMVVKKDFVKPSYSGDQITYLEN